MNIILKKIILRISLFLSLFFLYGCQAIVKPIAGNFDQEPKRAKKNLSPKAKKLIDQAFEGINQKCLRDFHVHSIGIGAGGTKAWVNPKSQKWTNFKDYFKYNIYMSASGIRNIKKADQEYTARLVELLNLEPRYGKVHLLAFDYHHDINGNVIKEKSSFYIPNEYVYELSKQFPDQFIPVISVHPYRKDALKELLKWAKKGIRYIKWLPNAQHIDPAHSRIDPYYEIMAKYNMVLLSHTGHEKAVDGEEFQKLGNPLRLKKALEKGVKVIMAHMASLGVCEDLDNPPKKVQCFDLFWRMMKSPRWKGLLFGEISGITIYTRMDKSIKTLLENEELQERFINGSDYPLPAINILFRTKQFLELGYINKEERESLNQIYNYNPILFDFVTKRTLKHPVNGKRLSPLTFESPKELGCQ